MPKLPKTIQKAADDAEVQDFSALEPGTYVVAVKEIDVTAKTKGGDPMWVWQFKVVDPEYPQYKNRTLFDRTALTESAAWKLKQLYGALGFTLDSDTDELIGEKCKVVVTQQEIPSGARKGQTGNNNDSYLALSDEETDALADAGGGDGEF